MINGLKPYANMKDSGLPWLGTMPTHWDIRRGKALFQCIDIRSVTGEEELLTVSSERGVVPRSSVAVTMFKAESYVGYKLCWPGDLVINSLWAWARGLGVSRYHGIVSSAYGVYRLRAGYESYSAYIHELVRSAAFQWELQVRSKGIWISRLQITDDAFLTAPFPLPPKEDQTAIIRFLDHADQRIRRHIRAKQKLIKLLDEQKQAIIHRAVTRGLDPNIRLKSSGIAWLDAIPEHWNEIRLKFLIRKITDGEHISPRLADEGIPLLSAKDIRDRTILYDVDKYVTQNHAQQFWRRCRPERGDLLVVSRGATIGRIAIVEQDLPFCLMGSVILCKRREDYTAEFLYYALNAHHAQTSLWFTSASSAQQAIYIRDVAELRLPIPPASEREDIVRHLEGSLSAMRDAAGRARREMSLLREYRTRLIADVVTGKLDVREAAARLPEEVSEVEPLDEMEDIPEDEGADHDGELEAADAA
jgi:type I restriction enzyme S subunit